ncbi:MAG: hypothetical protein NWF05_07520 [Candidatus Bathyarchaeota archaeon]|nr:hypothetical protein [Candidatus Bathyarchaeota archaeon]
MAPKKASVILAVTIAIAVALSLASSGVLNSVSSSQNVPSGGTITTVQASVNLGVFSDAACSQNASYVDWGALEAGSSTTETIWVKNVGSSAATLNLDATDWTPPNATPAISLSWNQEARVLAPGEVIQATLTLTVSETIDPSITAFSFNICITGTA